jgi:hypothetical protein
MVVAGLSAPPGYAPGPYGNFAVAKSIIARMRRIDDDGVSRAEEAWQFEADNGSVEHQLQFVGGPAMRTPWRRVSDEEYRR